MTRGAEVTTKTRRVRDFQRQKVYDAEGAAFRSGKDWSLVPVDFKTVAEVQEYVDTVTTSPFWQSLAPSVRTVTVKDGRSRRSGVAYPELGEIRMPRLTRRRWCTLHELAHIALGADDSLAFHGPEFTGTYLALVREFLGRAAGARLEATFKEYGVKVADLKADSVEMEVIETKVKAEATTPEHRAINKPEAPRSTKRLPARRRAPRVRMFTTREMPRIFDPLRAARDMLKGGGFNTDLQRLEDLTEFNALVAELQVLLDRDFGETWRDGERWREVGEK
jgi:putative metallohydrolase (TIGR04338 family)